MSFFRNFSRKIVSSNAIPAQQFSSVGNRYDLNGMTAIVTGGAQVSPENNRQTKLALLAHASSDIDRRELVLQSLKDSWRQGLK
jgi:hypothetical protein